MSASEGSIHAQALWLAAPRSPEFRCEVIPPPGHDEVRVSAIASGISQGTEMLVYRGQVPSSLPLDLPTFSGSFGFPIKYGYAMVGRVVNAGAGVQDLSPGDTVFVHHPHQTVFNIPASMPVHLPSSIEPMLGVFFANVETAVNVILDTPLKPGETALVFGQGTVGLLVTQLLKIAGASSVIVVDPLAIRRAVALKIGADLALEPAEDLPRQVRELTEGRGADVAIEASGAPAALQSAIDSVADEGTVIVVSWYGAKPVTLNLGGHFHRGRVAVRSSQVGNVDPALAPRWDRRRRTRFALEMMPRLRLRELITHCIPFEQAPEAYTLVDERPDDVVQAVLTYQREGS